MAGLFTVDPARSFLHGRPPRHSEPRPHETRDPVAQQQAVFDPAPGRGRARARPQRARARSAALLHAHQPATASRMHYKGRPIAGYDAVIPRIGASITRYGTAVLRQFELMGSYTPESVRRDPARARQAALPPAAGGAGHRPAGHGVRRQPRRHRRPAVDARPAAARDQAQRGHPGRRRDADREAVGLAQRDRGAARAVRQLPGAGIHRRGQGRGPALLRGRRARWSRRCGGRRRKGDFRSNLHRGGSAKAVRASSRPNRRSRSARRAVLGLGVAGVDLIRSRRGPLVLEVNASPGLEGIEAATGVDIAGRDHRPRGWPAPSRPYRRPAVDAGLKRFTIHLTRIRTRAFNGRLIASRVALSGPQLCLSPVDSSVVGRQQITVIGAIPFWPRRRSRAWAFFCAGDRARGGFTSACARIGPDSADRCQRGLEPTRIAAVSDSRARRHAGRQPPNRTARCASSSSKTTATSPPTSAITSKTAATPSTSPPTASPACTWRWSTTSTRSCSTSTCRAWTAWRSAASCATKRASRRRC